MSDKSRLSYLLSKYLHSSCTEQEELELAQLVQESGDQQLQYLLEEFWEKFAHQSEVQMPEPISGQVLHSILSQKEEDKEMEEEPYRKTFSIGKWIGIAASLLLVAGTAIYFFQNSTSNKTVSVATAPKPAVQDIAPGKSGAVLTLANGQQVSLDSVPSSGQFVQGQAGANIRIDGKQIVYGRANGSAAVEQYNTLTIPKGRTYQLTLPDGTKVWLNAASSLKYPVAFGNDMRQVYLEGEAYFEVAKLEKKNGSGRVPFKVNIVNHANPALNARVEVLGTHFNVKAYPDDSKIKTTLLEGRVDFYASQKATAAKLQPGNQAVDEIANEKTSVNTVDLNDAVAWKNGFFSFNHTHLTTVLRELSRWYNMEIVYKNEVPNRFFGGKIQKSLYLSEVLKILQMQDVQFKIEDGNKLVVM